MMFCQGGDSPVKKGGEECPLIVNYSTKGIFVSYLPFRKRE